MTQLKTLSKSSAEFDSYLRGTFSKTERARFVQTLNPNSAFEQVTFEILPVSQILRPRGISFLGPLLRVRKLVYILFPFLFVALNSEQNRQDPMALIFALLSLTFLFWAVYLRNDFTDHMKGLDRIYPRAGSQAIQKGWVTAESVKIWSWIYLVASIVLGLPLLWTQPKLITIVLLSTSLVYLSHFRTKSFFKTEVWGSWLQGFIIGPLLFVGLDILLNDHWGLETFCVGVVWGMLILFVIFLQDFETLVPSSQAGFYNWMSFLGFDRGRQFLQNWWLMCLCGFFVLQVLQRHWLIWISSFIIMLVFSFKFLKDMRNLETPAGSKVILLRQQGYTLFVLLVSLWSIEEICYSLFKSLFILWSRSV